MENMHIAFSPPDITEEEIAEVVDTLRSGWITTGPKTKLFEKQLAEYLEYYHLEKGYLLSFNFNKNKKTGLKEVEVDNKKIIEVVV